MGAQTVVIGLDLGSVSTGIAAVLHDFALYYETFRMPKSGFDLIERVLARLDALITLHGFSVSALAVERGYGTDIRDGADWREQISEWCRERNIILELVAPLSREHRRGKNKLLKGRHESDAYFAAIALRERR